VGLCSECSECSGVCTSRRCAYLGALPPEMACLTGTQSAEPNIAASSQATSSGSGSDSGTGSCSGSSSGSGSG
jgi:hypothetical protein